MKKGFTLIELLVVIAIIAILAVVIVLTINPAELLRQGRDATRVSDMGTINKAVSLYYQDAMNSPSTMFMGTSSVIYVSVPDPTASAPAGNNCSGLGLPTAPTGYTYHCAASSTYFKTDGTGWIPINFNSYSAGTVISKLPTDPVNTTSTNLYYTYETDGIGGFKVAAFFESQKDAPQMANDSGNDPELYEKGSNLALASGRGLVGYWPMDEGSGTSTLDASGNVNTGTWSGTQTGSSGYYSTGRVGPWSGMFDGATDGISISNSASLNTLTGSFTISHWIKTTAATVQMYTISNAGSSNGYRFGLSGGKIAFLVGNGSTYTETTCGSKAVNDGTWHMISGVFNLSGANQFSCYLDGAIQANVSLPSSYSGMQTNAPGIGKPPCCQIFNGSLDDIRIYNRALSAAEIQEMYNAEK